MDIGVWQASVHGVTKNWTQLKRLRTHAHRSLYTKHRNAGLLYSAKKCTTNLTFKNITKAILLESSFSFLPQSPYSKNGSKLYVNFLHFFFFLEQFFKEQFLGSQLN